MTNAGFPPFNTRLGSQIIGPRYHFTDEGALVEAARGMLAMGADVIKFNLASGYLGMPHDPSLRTAAALAAHHPHFKAVLDLPFRYFVLWVHPHAHGMDAPLRWSAQEEAEIYAEMYALTAHLLTAYTGSGKLFLLGQWEADWVLIGAFAPEREVEPARAAGMIRYLQLRQQAVEDARRTVAHTGVWVGHFAEVNRPLDAKVRGLRRMTNGVLPHVTVDMISYSAYDALWPQRITEALDYIEGQAQFTSYLDSVFARKVFIGEYDAYRDYHRQGYFTPAQQVENTLAVISSGLAWGAPLILFWEYYNNEHERLIHGGGFWLVDDQGVKQPVYDLHRDLLARLNALANLQRFWYGRNPTDREVNEWAGELQRISPSTMLARLLDATVYAAEVSAEAFAQRATLALYGETAAQAAAYGRALARLQAGQRRYNVLLGLLDEPAWAEAMPAAHFQRAYSLDRQTIPAGATRSSLWLRQLDRLDFLLGELAQRHTPTTLTTLQARYFPNAT